MVVVVTQSAVCSEVTNVVVAGVKMEMQDDAVKCGKLETERFN